MTTRLDGPLKRELTINGTDYKLTIAPRGLTLVFKGKRKGFELEWTALVSGDAALATALNASLAANLTAVPPPAPGKRAPRRAGASKK